MGVFSAEVALASGLPGETRGGARILVGRREWVGLPDLGVSPLNAKTDSGARSCSLHAEEVELSADGSRVGFVTVDHYGNRRACEAAVAGVVRVRSSTGVLRKRVFIETRAVFPGGLEFPVRMSLANRAVMRCPMLLGRRALAGYFLVDPQGSHLMGGVRDLERFVPGTRPS